MATFFKSNKVYVFPCAYRAENKSTAWLPTEHNWVLGCGRKQGKDSYIISYRKNSTAGTTLTYIECVIGGYYFKLNDVSIENYTKKSLAIHLTTLNVSGQPQLFLGDYNGNSGITSLDTDGDNGQFTGLALLDEQDSIDNATYLLSLADLNKDEVLETSLQHSSGNYSFETKVPVSSLEGSISPNAVTGDYSAAFGYGNNIATNQSFVVGNSNNIITGNNSVVFGTENTSKAANSYLFGQSLKNETSQNKVVIGKYNSDVNTAIFEVGNGSANERKNALTIAPTSSTFNTQLKIIPNSTNKIEYTGNKFSLNDLVILDGSALNLKNNSTTLENALYAKGLVDFSIANFKVNNDKLIINSTDTSLTNTNVNINGALNISGSTAISGDDITLIGATTINGSVNLTGNAALNYNDKITSDNTNLNITIPTSISNSLQTNSLVVDTTATVKGATTLENTLTAKMPITITAGNALNFGENLSLKSTAKDILEFGDTAKKTIKVDTLALTKDTTEYFSTTTNGSTTTVTLGQSGNITYNNTSGSEVFSLNKNLSVTGTITATGLITGYNFNATLSDAREKTNIVDYINTASILDIPVKEFEYINDESHRKHIGFIAQDLLAVYPELVIEYNGRYAIEETKLVYLLLDEVKKLRAEVDALKK